MVFVRRLSALDRVLINQGELLEACKQWRQPAATPSQVVQQGVKAALAANPPKEVAVALRGAPVPPNLQWHFR